MNRARVCGTIQAFRSGLVVALFASLLGACGKNVDAVSQAGKRDVAAGVPAPGIEQTKAIAEQACIYGFPMIAAHKVMYEFNVDKSSPQFKVGFNQVWNDGKTFTPKVGLQRSCRTSSSTSTTRPGQA